MKPCVVVSRAFNFTLQSLGPEPSQSAPFLPGQEQTYMAVRWHNARRAMALSC